MLLLLLGGAAGAQGGIIVVNTTRDVVDFDGARMIANLPGPDGLVSLAEAVVAANNTPGPDTIAFNIPTTDRYYNLPWLPGAFVLFVESSAPLILTDNGTTIDGTTQTIFTGDTAAGPEIHLRTTSPYASVPAFLINSHSNTVRGIQGFSLFQYGVQINGNGNEIVGNIMTQPGSAAVRVAGRNNRIGGLTTADANRLSSAGSGVWLSGSGATGNIVQGNVIWRNWGDGITIDNGASGNTIGGPGAAQNVIFANGHTSSERFPVGASIEVSGNNNVIIGNQIGLDESGQPNAGSVWSGIELWGSGNVVQSNIISGHADYYPQLAARKAGVRLSGGTNNVISGNWIGTDAGGTLRAGNGYGIKVDVWNFSNVPTGHTIGGTNAGAGNIIAYSQHDGIAVRGNARAIRILGNFIFQNGELGINLGVDPYTQAYPDTVTANDSGDGDMGANELQNFPVITSAVSIGPTTEARGTIDTPNPQTVRVELFVNQTVDPTGFGEGQRFAGSATPAVDGRWSTVLAGDLSGKFITATATDAAGNTSEFSRAVAVSGFTYGPPLVATNCEYASGRFSFLLPASTGTVVIIESSTDLAHWVPLATNTGVATPFHFNDVAPPVHHRFYRARLP